MQYLLDRFKGMVNPELMIRLTNAMYANKDVAPRYDEFRDMFSSGQLISKFWMLERLARVNERIEFPIQSTMVVGGWYGLMSYFLHKQFPGTHNYSLDIEQQCTDYINLAFNAQADRIVAVSADMYEFNYDAPSYDLIINSACEHIPDVRQWLDKLPKGQLVALQSNNNDSIPDHINCPQSLQQFRDQVQLSSTEEVGELNFPMYTRYMIIGRT